MALPFTQQILYLISVKGQTLGIRSKLSVPHGRCWNRYLGNNETEKEDGDAGRVVTGLVWVIRKTPLPASPYLGTKFCRR